MQLGKPPKIEERMRADRLIAQTKGVKESTRDEMSFVFCTLMTLMCVVASTGNFKCIAPSTKYKDQAKFRNSFRHQRIHHLTPQVSNCYMRFLYSRRSLCRDDNGYVAS